LHPIRYELKEDNAQSIYLVCDEIGKADLDKVKDPETDSDDTVLNYESNDVVPDPFAYLSVINAKNRDTWIAVMVNYCFRWVFGIPDAARRNLMLQRSTGQIYSIDETGIERVNHVTVWGGKKPNKEIFKLIRAFVGSIHLNEVLIEVERWKESLDFIRREVFPISTQIEAKIDRLLVDPNIVFDV
jgi:hypothetical protein